MVTSPTNTSDYQLLKGWSNDSLNSGTDCTISGLQIVDQEMNPYQMTSQGEVHRELTKSSMTKTLAHAQPKIVDSRKEIRFESAEISRQFVAIAYHNI